MRRSPPPIVVSAEPGEVRARWHSARRIDEARLWRLRSACSSVVVDTTTLIESAGDWWPLGLRWARHDQVPALPEAVVTPQTLAELCDVLRVCNGERIPVTVAGGRSGVCGGAIPLQGGVALDMRAFNGVRALDDTSLLVDVAAGMNGAALEDTLRSEYGVTLGHWPQSIALSTVGGWVACRAAGQYSTRYGKIEDIVAGLEVVLADGEVVRTGSMAAAGPRSAMGPDLTQLILGSEGTLGVVTTARMRVHPLAAAERRAAWSVPAFAAGLDAIRRTVRRGATPAAVRLYDAEEAQRNFGRDGALLIALDEGDPAIVDASMGVLTAECSEFASLGNEPVDHWYATRNDVSALGTVLEMGVVVDTVEISAAWSQLPALYEEAVRGLRDIEGTVAASAHQSHAYLDGACLYFTFAGLGAGGENDGWAELYYEAAWEVIMRATLAHRGSVSHHHGIGLLRGRYIPAALGEGFGVLQRLKTALDPNGILNPGKLGLGPVPALHD